MYHESMLHEWKKSCAPSGGFFMNFEALLYYYRMLQVSVRQKHIRGNFTVIHCLVLLITQLFVSPESLKVPGEC